jgi:hypothetical protein
MITLSMHIVTYLIEYLGEFEFIFENILDYELGDQMGTFYAKKRHRKSHAWAPLSLSLPPPPHRYILQKPVISVT